MQPITKGITGSVVSELLVPNPEALTSPAMYGEALTSLNFEHVQPFKMLDDQDENMSTLVNCNNLHIHQAYDTLFAKKEMQDYIGKYGTGEVTREILVGNFDPNKYDNLPAVNYWIKNNLKCVAAANLVKITLMVEELKRLLKKQNEGTSSSPSGQHYGHYKVLIDYEDILEIHCVMMTLPFSIPGVQNFTGFVS
eukprot:14454745-Ditylum_brightwellii.AAC.1